MLKSEGGACVDRWLPAVAAHAVAKVQAKPRRHCQCNPVGAECTRSTPNPYRLYVL